MRRIGMFLWLLRVVLPAILAYWSRRLMRASRRWIGGTGLPGRVEDPTAALIQLLAQANAASSTIILLLVLVVLLRLSTR